MSFRHSVLKRVAGKVGFTLAEVLVALTIVGIIAAMIVPALISRTNDVTSVTSFKQVVSDLSAATKKLEMTNGAIPATTYGDLINAYKTVLNYYKEDIVKSVFNSKYLCYKSSTVCLDYTANTLLTIVLHNGVVIFFDEMALDCTDSSGSLTGICGYIAIDVNGKRGPNMEGKDLFMAWLVRKNNTYVIMPMGSGGDGISCVVGSTDYNTSEGCATYALMNNLP